MDTRRTPDCQTIALAGGTGHLGRQIAARLGEAGAAVRLLTRADFADPAALREACEGAGCVVSALAGLGDVVIDLQARLLAAAVEAGVPRFIPSAYAIDYMRLPPGRNRNLDLRRRFEEEHLARAKIAPTSVLCGAFIELLAGQAPFLLRKPRRVLCWGDPKQKMDFTATADVAAYTAHASLDPDTPRYLRIAGVEISAEGLAAAASAVTGKPYRVLRPGSLAAFRKVISLVKLLTPKSDELYPPWQGMQYMHDMYEGAAKLHPLDNERYPIKWTGVEAYLT